MPVAEEGIPRKRTAGRRPRGVGASFHPPHLFGGTAPPTPRAGGAGREKIGSGGVRGKIKFLYAPVCLGWGERAVLCFLRAIFIRREYTPSPVLREGGGVENMSLNVAESLKLGCTLDALSRPFPRCPRDARRTPPNWRHSALPAQRCSPQGGGMRAAAP